MIATCIYALTDHGGLRSPDSEVVLRVAEAMVDRQSFAPSDLEAWHKFGVAPGVDGRYYSVYPPVESFWMAAWLPLARAIAGGLGDAPVSHYYGTDLQHVLLGDPVQDMAPHRVRYVLSFLDVLLASLAVTIFYLIVFRLTQSRVASFFVSLVYAFGTIMWSYAGSGFSESLAMVLILGSYHLLDDPAPTYVMTRRFMSALSLGLAIGTHVTAFLFVPFLLVRALPPSRKWPAAGVWILGLTLVLVLLGWYNADRFGDWFESGRNLSRENKVAWAFVFSEKFWHNLYGVFFGASKGIFIFFPLLVVVLIVWPAFHRAQPALSKWLILLVIVRVVFNAAYVDWHGGYSVGPRYLVMIIPFTLIPLAWWLARRWEERSLGPWIVAGLAACVASIEQWYFVAGEMFSFYHLINFHNLQRGINVFVDDRIYLDWSLSPIGHLLEFQRGPFLLRGVHVSNTGLWVAGSGVIAGLTVAWLIYVFQRMPRQPGKTGSKGK